MQVRIRNGLIAALFGMVVLLVAQWLFKSYLITALIGGGVIGYVVVGLTNAQSDDKANNAVARPETRFAARVSEQIKTAYCLINRQGIIVYYNPAMARLFPHINRGEHYSLIARASNFLDPIRRQLIEGRDQTRFDFETQRNGVRFFEGHLSVLNERLQQRTNGYLLLEIHDQTTLRNNDHMRQDFIANASHELRTPLSAIIGGIETMQTQSDLDSDDRNAVLKIMDRQAQRMGRLIGDLMSLASIETHAHQRPDSEVQLDDIIGASIEATRKLVKDADVSLINNVEGHHILRADGDQLQQVFINLIENAVYYGQAGQRITISTLSDSQRYSDRLGVRVSDQGQGIAPADINRITQRFYRVDSAVSRHKGGTGLGLAIVKHILRRHDAILEIESVLGEGSDFTIWFHK